MRVLSLSTASRRSTWFVRPWTGVRSYIEFDVHSCPTAGFVMPLAFGSRLSMRWPAGRAADARRGASGGGMMFPGNATPVLGSMIGWMVPFVIRVCEKSPAFSSAVGMFVRVTGRRPRVVGVFLRHEEVELLAFTLAGAAVHESGNHHRSAQAVARDVDPIERFRRCSATSRK